MYAQTLAVARPVVAARPLAEGVVSRTVVILSILAILVILLGFGALPLAH